MLTVVQSSSKPFARQNIVGAGLVEGTGRAIWRQAVLHGCIVKGCIPLACFVCSVPALHLVWQQLLHSSILMLGRLSNNMIRMQGATTTATASTCVLCVVAVGCPAPHLQL